MAEAQELVNLITKIISRPNTPSHSRPTTPIPLSGESTSVQNIPQPQPRGYKDYSRPSKFALQTSRSVGTQTESSVDQYLQIQRQQSRALEELESRRSAASRVILTRLIGLTGRLDSSNGCIFCTATGAFILFFILIGMVIYLILLEKRIA